MPRFAEALPPSPLDALQAPSSYPDLAQLTLLAGRLFQGRQKRLEEPEDGQSRKQCEQGLAPGHRGRHYKLHDGMVHHGLTRGTVSKCRRCRIAKSVGVKLRHEKGAKARASFSDVVTCGSVWACPICGNRIRAERAKELVKMVGAHGASRTAMLTLTVRHAMGNDFKQLLLDLSLAWKKFQQGKEWEVLCSSFGVLGTTRALEATHGSNGWHPHYHAIVYLDRPLDTERLDELCEEFSARWRRKVRLVLGDAHVPDEEHGCDLRRLHEAKYLSKMGLELTDFATKKKGRRGSRTPWQIAVSAVDGLDSSDPQEITAAKADKVLWLNYAVSIKGRKMLTHSTWASALRVSLGIDDESDEELAGDGEREEDKDDVREVIVARLEPFEWKAVCCVRGGRGRLLDLVEQGAGAVGVMQYVLSCRRVVEDGEKGRVVVVDDDLPDRSIDSPD